MKLLIEIPDDYVEEFKMQQNFLGMEKEDIIESAFGMARYSIANGIPLEDIKEQYDKGYKDGVKETFNAELKNIKTEIEELIQHCDTDYDFEEIYGIRQAIEILDNHISELKGENNDT